MIRAPSRHDLLTTLVGVVSGALLVISVAALRGAIAPSQATAAARPTPVASSYVTILSASGRGAANGFTAPVLTRAYTVGVSWRIVAREVCSDTAQVSASAQSIGIGVLDAGEDTLAGMQVGYVTLLGSCVSGQQSIAILSERGAGRYQLRIQAWEPWSVSVQSLDTVA